MTSNKRKTKRSVMKSGIDGRKRRLGRRPSNMVALKNTQEQRYLIKKEEDEVEVTIAEVRVNHDRTEREMEQNSERKDAVVGKHIVKDEVFSAAALESSYSEPRVVSTSWFPFWRPIGVVVYLMDSLAYGSHKSVDDVVDLLRKVFHLPFQIGDGRFCLLGRVLCLRQVCR